MASIAQIVTLAVLVTCTLLFSGIAISGSIRGRLKMEPNQPWIVCREHPVKFFALVLFNAGLAIMCGVTLARIAAVLPR
ncbi:MAG TPA: hypothetical protein VF590_21635 [Isosphaeraceae bacterium]|jgi:hypothetical protein